jgi:DNA-binding transcriptional MerR regulator
VDEDLVSIGRFARLCRLTVKRLRHYDEQGLLRPAHVDAATGYRYYRRDQAGEALTIGLLRALDVPLPVITEVLSRDPEAVDRALRGQRDRLAAEIRHRERLLATVQRLIADGVPGAEVTLADEPARQVLVARATAAPERLGPVVGRCIADALAAAGDRVAGCPIGVYPLDGLETAEMPVAVAIPVAAEPGSETLAGGPVAATIHIGAYEQVPIAYHALLSWLYARGHTPLGEAREEYLVGPATAEPDGYVTRITIPIEAEGAHD